MESAEGRPSSEQLMLARQLLAPRRRQDPAWPALAAAAFFACSAMTFAVTAIMTPAKDPGPIPARTLDGGPR